MTTDGLLVKSGDVLICTDEIVSLGRASISRLKRMADESPKHRARICAHKDNSAAIHEMIIVINRESYISPHRHAKKCESFHLVEGDADIVVFDDSGEIQKVIRFSKDHAFYYRLDTERFHTIVVRSESIVFHEVTNGPFVPGATEYAKFAPSEGDSNVNPYRTRLNVQIKAWLSRKQLA